MKSAASGIVTARRFEELLPILQKRGDTPYVKKDLEMRINPFMYMKDAKSIIVHLFPYRNRKFDREYRDTAKTVLRNIAADLPFKTKCFLDYGGLVERHLAYLAGLGFFGQNNLLYNEKLGSRFYIGYIITDQQLTPDTPISGSCLKCNKCIKACPTHALGEDFEFNPYKCLAYLTDNGCDVCTDVCPMNES